MRDFYTISRYGKRRGDPTICDLTFGNPHEMPLGGLVTTLRERAVPKDKDWFAYKTSEQEPQAFLAQRLRRELALPFEPPDIALTTGAFAAIMVAFRRRRGSDFRTGMVLLRTDASRCRRSSP